MRNSRCLWVLLVLTGVEGEDIDPEDGEYMEQEAGEQFEDRVLQKRAAKV